MSEPRTDEEWERTGHGAIRKHYPRLGDALRGFLGQGVTTTVCDGCGTPMVLRDGRWSVTEAEAQRLTVERLRETIHRMKWCKATETLHAFAHGDDPEDDELRARFMAEYAALAHPEEERSGE